MLRGIFSQQMKLTYPPTYLYTHPSVSMFLSIQYLPLNLALHNPQLTTVAMVTYLPSLTSEVGPAVLLCCALPQKSLTAFNAKGDKEAMVLHTLHPSSQNLQKVE